MSIKILMPALSPTMTEGNLVKWLVKKGDDVKAGDIIAEIETDKATMELEAVDEGKITSILVNEGTKGIAINSPIAILDEEENEKNLSQEDADNKKIKNEKLISENKINEEKSSLKSSKKNLKQISKINKNVIASPYAKKLANKLNINIDTVTGSGPNKRIIERDLNKHQNLSKENISSKQNEVIEPSTIRKIIADRTTTTKSTIPHFYLTVESEVNKLLKLKEVINKQNIEYKVSINDILVKALAIAQKNNPNTNVSWLNSKIIKYSNVDVAIAVALKDGLITPIIKNADKKGLLEISKEIKILVKKAKDGKLLPDEYNGGTISISNLGMYDITEFIAIINPPQSSIMAIGSIQQKLKLVDNKVHEVNIIKSTLSADHRALDGAVAAKLLKDFNDIIENPFNLWLESDDLKII